MSQAFRYALFLLMEFVFHAGFKEDGFFKNQVTLLMKMTFTRWFRE